MWIGGERSECGIPVRWIDVHVLWSTINIFPGPIRGRQIGYECPGDSQRKPPHLSTFGCSYPHKIATYPHLYVERGRASLWLSRHNQADWRLEMRKEREKMHG